MYSSSETALITFALSRSTFSAYDTTNLKSFEEEKHDEEKKACVSVRVSDSVCVSVGETSPHVKHFERSFVHSSAFFVDANRAAREHGGEGARKSVG